MTITATRPTAPQTPFDVIWGGYPRISSDPDDLRAGVDRQIEDITDAVIERGGDPDKIVWFPENDTSAWKKKKIKVVDAVGNEYFGWRVVRPVWHEALRALRAAEVHALMVWDLDRLARDARDLEDAIECVEHYGARIEGVTQEDIILTTSNGRSNARSNMNAAIKASADASRRVKRSSLATARSGRAVGQRSFGWQDLLTLHPVEAPIARQMVADVIAGKPVRAVARDLNANGVRTTKGKDWTNVTVRQYLTNSRLVGIRRFNRQVVLDREGQPVVGNWEPLLDQQTWDLLCSALHRPETRGYVPRRGAYSYILSGLLSCGVCGGVMFGSVQHGAYSYACGTRARYGNEHYLSISGARTEAFIADMVVRHMADQRVEPPADCPWEGEAQLAQSTAMINEVMTAYRAGQLSSTLAFQQVGILEAEVRDLSKARAQWLLSTIGPALPEAVDMEQWDAMDMAQQRALVERLCETILIKPSTMGRTWDSERIDVVPRPR